MESGKWKVESGKGEGSHSCTSTRRDRLALPGFLFQSIPFLSMHEHALIVLNTAPCPVCRAPVLHSSDYRMLCSNKNNAQSRPA